VLSSARRVLNARDSRRKAGVPDLVRWTGRRRTGNGAHRKASDSVKPPVAEAAVVGADAEAGARNAVVAAVGDKRSQLGW
jgi:hypothetical protein